MTSTPPAYVHGMSKCVWGAKQSFTGEMRIELHLEGVSIFQ